MKFRVRFNKSAGQPGRGTIDHKWRVFDESGKEYLCKQVVIEVPSWTSIDTNANDWNFEAIGEIDIDREQSKITIKSESLPFD
jgi:hypothetical protein